MMPAKLPVQRLVVLGDARVGKTTLTLQLILSSFPKDYDPTYEDQYRTRMTVDSKVYDIEVLDVGSWREFKEMRSQWTEYGEAILIVYSITQRESFDLVREIHQQILDSKENKYLVLVGNKTDEYQQRKVSLQEGQTLAEELGCKFFEISTKKHAEAMEPIHHVCSLIHRHRLSEDRPANDSIEKLVVKPANLTWMPLIWKILHYIWTSLHHNSQQSDRSNESQV